MKKVTGIGGIFFKCKDTEAQRQWYGQHLGFKTDAYGTNFGWRHMDKPEKKGYSVWAPFPESTDYFEPSQKEFMINFRVDNLEELVNELKQAGISLIGEIQVYPYGKFAHIVDPEGNKIELWEDNDDKYENLTDKNVTA